MDLQKIQNESEVLQTNLIARKNEILAVLPSNCSFEKFARIVKTSTLKDPDLLLKADRRSLLNSCLQAAQDGLLPDGREAAFVMFSTKQKDGSYKTLVQYMPMIGGVLKKIRNSGELATISAHVVYENDEFDYCLGDDEYIKHKPSLSQRGKALCVYAIAKTKDNAIYREVMSVNEIEEIRNISKAKNSLAWLQHWGEMARKTVIRRLAKRLPMSTELDQIIRKDDELFTYNELEKKEIILQENSTLDIINSQINTISESPQMFLQHVEIEEDKKDNLFA